MPHSFRHSSSQREPSHRRSGRSGSSEPGAPFHRRRREEGERQESAGASAAGSRPRHRSSPQAGGSSGKKSALLCVLVGGLGFAIILLASLSSYTRQSPTHSAVDLVAGLCALVSFAAGAHAQATQLRHWSRRVKRKVLVGLPIALCTVLAVGVDVRQRAASANGGKAATPAPAARSSERDAKPEDDSLIKPGWYGEILANGVLVVVTSFEENAAESRRFNRGLFKPVTYATLSVINTGSGSPVTLLSPRVTLLLEGGEKIASLDCRELLAHADSLDATLLSRRLADQQEVAVGGMIPDIPICMDASFSWSRAVAVEVQIGAGTVTVPGRMMTAQEKQMALEAGQSATRRPGTNVTAEAWYKNL